MTILAAIDFLAWCAVMNRARGSTLYGLTTSTTASRLVAMLGIAGAVCLLALFNGLSNLTATALLLWTWAFLMFWCTFAWDKYWSAAIGNPIGPEPAFPPVDWIMAKIPLNIHWSATGLNMQLRLWGLLAMSLRQTLAAPWVIGLAFLAGHSDKAWLAVFTPLLGAFYFAFGFVSQAYAVMLAELAVGAALGLLAIIVC